MSYIDYFNDYIFSLVDMKTSVDLKAEILEEHQGWQDNEQP